MKLLLAIAVIAIIAIVIISLQRSGPRVTEIDRSVKRDDDDDAR